MPDLKSKLKPQIGRQRFALLVFHPVECTFLSKPFVQFLWQSATQLTPRRNAYTKKWEKNNADFLTVKFVCLAIRYGIERIYCWTKHIR